MKDHLRENWVLYLLWILIISLFVLMIWAINGERKYCESKGGHIVNLYKSSICVKDGLIIE